MSLSKQPQDSSSHITGCFSSSDLHRQIGLAIKVSSGVVKGPSPIFVTKQRARGAAPIAHPTDNAIEIYVDPQRDSEILDDFDVALEGKSSTPRGDNSRFPAGHAAKTDEFQLAKVSLPETIEDLRHLEPRCGLDHVVDVDEVGLQTPR